MTPAVAGFHCRKAVAPLKEVAFSIDSFTRFHCRKAVAPLKCHHHWIVSTAERRWPH